MHLIVTFPFVGGELLTYLVSTLRTIVRTVLRLLQMQKPRKIIQRHGSVTVICSLMVQCDESIHRTGGNSLKSLKKTRFWTIPNW